MHQRTARSCHSHLLSSAIITTKLSPAASGGHQFETPHGQRHATPKRQASRTPRYPLHSRTTQRVRWIGPFEAHLCRYQRYCYLPPPSFPTHQYEGTIFDVSKKVDVYGKEKSYNLFAGKDASKALGMSSLKSEDAVSDYSTLPEDEMRVLEDWYSFFKCVGHPTLFSHMSNPIPRKRYNIVGRVADLPPPSANL